MAINLNNSKQHAIMLSNRLDSIRNSMQKSTNCAVMGMISIPGVSKFSIDEDIKSDLDLKMPMAAEIQVLCEGPNRDGMVSKQSLEESLNGWKDLPIIDWHDKSPEPTAHKISDRKGYTTGPAQMRYIENKWWLVVPAEIINRDFAYQMYLRNLKGKPLEVSAEFGFVPTYINGIKHQSRINPKLLTITDYGAGHIKGNKVSIIPEGDDE